MNVAMEIQRTQTRYVCFGEINSKWTLVGCTTDPSVAESWEKESRREVFVCKRQDWDKLISDFSYTVTAPIETRYDITKLLEAFVNEISQG